MKIILIKPYENSGGRLLKVGQILEVDAAQTKRLIADKTAKIYKPPSTAKKTTKPKTKPLKK